MGNRRKAKVMLIDDDLQSLRPLQDELEALGRIKPDLNEPGDVELRQLLDADVVIVDFDIEHWESRDRLSELALRPLDGIGLAAVLQTHLRRSESPAPAVALLTGRIQKLAHPAPLPGRALQLAQAHGLEWIFKKSATDSAASLVDQISSLGTAVRDLRFMWKDSRSLADLLGLLGVRKSDRLRDRYLSEVEACQPPLHELATWNSNQILRWLLHRILPFPTFLWDVSWLAARLRVRRGDLTAALQRGDQIAEEMRRFRYRGLLNGFLGERWWRAGVEDWLWRITGQSSDDTKAVRAAVRSRTGAQLADSDSDRPIVCLDEDMCPLERTCGVGEAVRIQPDGWPSYAQSAWARLDDARATPRLRALVISDDLEKLQ